MQVFEWRCEVGIPAMPPIAFPERHEDTAIGILDASMKAAKK